ncbi:hypothetical protein [Parasitella parasitica]|uniref:Uncharacterized protein n=1 Tax=Parasitella parasitica TaxID=35722 RepID=A0A0B7N585_9FUNG|nr:hypothetical protein [Parasitella parasitica]
MNEFIEDFLELKNAAEIRDEDCLVRYLFKALPEELAQATKFYINNAAEKDQVNIDFAISKVVGTYEALFKGKWEKELFYQSRSEDNLFGKNKIHRFQDNKKKKVFSSGGNHNMMKCRYHPGLTNHSVEDEVWS